MARITIDDKIYNGRLIFEDWQDIYTISIYHLYPIHLERYLVIHIEQKVGGKDFVVSGLDKILEIIDLFKVKTSITKTRHFLLNKKSQFIDQCTHKSLKKIDIRALKEKLNIYYDKNYSQFVFAGIRYNEFVNTPK